MLLITESKQRGPSWEAKNGYPKSQDISHVLQNPNVHYRVHKSLPPVPILNKMNVIKGLSLYFYRIFLLLLLFSRLYNVSTSSCAHLTIIVSSSSSCLCHSSLLPLIPFFSPISPLIPSAQVSLGLPRFLLPGGRHFITSFGNLPSSILWTCPYHWSCFVLISSKRDIVTFIFCLIIVFLILPFLEILAERRQKSISVEFNFSVVFAFKHPVSAAYVIVLLTIAW